MQVIQELAKQGITLFQDRLNGSEIAFTQEPSANLKLAVDVYRKEIEAWLEEYPPEEIEVCWAIETVYGTPEVSSKAWVHIRSEKWKTLWPHGPRWWRRPWEYARYCVHGKQVKAWRLIMDRPMTEEDWLSERPFSDTPSSYQTLTTQAVRKGDQDGHGEPGE